MYVNFDKLIAIRLLHWQAVGGLKSSTTVNQHFKAHKFKLFLSLNLIEWSVSFWALLIPSVIVDNFFTPEAEICDKQSANKNLAGTNLITDHPSKYKIYIETRSRGEKQNIEL